MGIWQDIGPDARRLIIARGLRSLGQGAMLVDFTLYLRAMHWSAPLIGTVLMSALLLGTLCTLFVGPLSDRAGRKKFLLGYETVQAVAGLAALLTSSPVVLVPAALAGGFGRGGNGAAGPFAPVEQSWLAHLVPADCRARVFSWNAAVGATGMALGAVLGALPAVTARWLPGALAYRPLFALVMIGALLSLLLLRRAQDIPPAPPDPQETQPAANRQENRLLILLMGINSLNGLGIGLVGPLMAWWFAARFGAPVQWIGPVIALGFLLTAAMSLASGWLSLRIGVVRSVVVMRLAALALLFLLPLMPNFALAAAAHIIRTALNQGTGGTRQALNMRLVRAHRRGLAATLNSISLQIPRAIGPAIAGLFFHNGWLDLPFFLATLLQGGYLYCYQKAFRPHEHASLEP